MNTNHTETTQTKSARILRKSMRMVFVAVAVLVFTIFIVDFFKPPLKLTSFKKNLEDIAQDALGMSVAIEGDCHLILGWPLAVEMQDLRLRQPDDQADLLRLAYFKVGVEIWPLIMRKLRFAEIVAHGLDIDLRDSDGSVIRPEDRVGMLKRRGAPPEIPSKKPSIWRVEVTRIDLRDTTICVGRDASPHTVTISEILGSATEEYGIKLDMKGFYRNMPWNVVWKSHSLTDLLAHPSAWPFGMSADYAGATLVLSGRINFADMRGVFDVRFTGSSGPELQSLLGDAVAEFDSYHFSFHLDVSESKLHMSALEGELGNTRFTGNAQWDGVAKRLTGAVNAARLDLGPVIRAVYAAGGPDPQPDSGMDTYGNILFTLPETLPGLDIDVRFACNQILGVPGELRKATARLVAADGRLHFPVSVLVLGTTVGSETTLSWEENSVHISVEATSDRADIGRLTEGLPGVKGVAGRLDGLVFSAAATGTDVPMLLNDLEARLDVRNANLSVHDPFAKDPMRLVLDTATLSLPAGAGLKGAVTGRLAGKPFKLNLTGGSMRDILEKPHWPIKLRFSGSGAKIHLAGTISAPGSPVGANLALRLSGDRIGDLAEWTGISPLAAMPYELKTDILLHQNRTQIDIHQLIAGNSRLRGVIKKRYTAKRRPQSAVSINADMLDLRQLKTIFLLPGVGNKRVRVPSLQPRTGDDFARIMNTMVFPEEFHLPEMDLNLEIRRLITDKLAYDRCSLKAIIQKDHTTQSHFRFYLGEASFRGEAFLDLGKEPPMLGLRFSTKRYELSELLDALNVAKGVEASVGAFEINMTTRGRRIYELILKREITASVKAGRLEVKTAFSAFDINIGSAVYSDRPGEPFVLNLRGHILNAPLNIRWVTQKIRSEDGLGARRASRLEAKFADTRLVITGHLVFPLRLRGIPNQLNISGKRLNSLDPLLNWSLPPLGPYEMSGVIRILPQGYSLSDAVFAIGDSRFRGHIEIVREDSRPKVAANLKAETLNLKDFDFLNRELKPGEQRATVSKYIAHISNNKEYRRQLRRLIDPSAPSAFDADIAIEVSEMLAGGIQIDGFTLRIIHGDNRLSVPSLAFSTLGGDVKGSLELINTGEGINGTLKGNIHQVNFGPLLQLKDPNAKNRGQVSMIIDLKSTARSTETLMGKADGRFAVLIHPENIGAGVVDFWATNILLAVLSAFNPDSTSKINCIVADLTMADGVMKEKTIVVDTSKVRVLGKTRVDFKKQTVYLKLNPRPKQPQFLYLATPMEASGTFSDFRAGPNPAGLLQTVFGLLTDPVVVPFQWIILNKLPEDGSDVCPDVIN